MSTSQGSLYMSIVHGTLCHGKGNPKGSSWSNPYNEAWTSPLALSERRTTRKLAQRSSPATNLQAPR